MIYNKEIGCGFDAIIYGMLEFSKDNYVKYMAKKFGFTDPLAFYDEFKDSANVLTPIELYPFFFNNGENSCFLSWYTYNKHDKFNDTFVEFLDQIKSDENIVREVYLHYLRDKYDEDTIPIDDPAKIFEEIINLELDSTLAKQLLYAYKNTTESIDTLVNYLYEVYTKLCKFHEKMYTMQEREIDSLSNENMLKSLEIYCNVDKRININEQTISVSFMLKYILFYQRSKKMLKCIFIMGLEDEKFIAKLIDYKYINAEIVLTTLASPIKRDILKVLKKKHYQLHNYQKNYFRQGSL